jgi:micrococcal nuclease
VTRLAVLAALVVAAVAFLVQGRDAAPAPGGDAVVQRVVDGDTVVLSGVGKARLIGIDTPEVYGRVECYGPAASAYTKRLLPQRAAVRYRLGVEPRDRYGRALVYLWTADGRFVNAQLAREGYATQLTIAPNVEYASRLRALVREAREAGRGLWRSCPSR